MGSIFIFLVTIALILTAIILPFISALSSPKKESFISSSKNVNSPICPVCNSSLPPNAQYCPECGFDVRPVSSYVPFTLPKEAKRYSNLSFFFLCIFLICLIFLVFPFFLFIANPFIILLIIALLILSLVLSCTFSSEASKIEKSAKEEYDKAIESENQHRSAIIQRMIREREEKARLHEILERYERQSGIPPKDED